MRFFLALADRTRGASYGPTLLIDQAMSDLIRGSSVKISMFATA
ncbi:MAG: hypothetical protein ABI614_25465 [Planctomycetota bacterium]